MIGDPIEDYSPVIYVAMGIVIIIAYVHLFMSTHGLNNTSERIILIVLAVFGVLLCFFLGWLYDRIHDNRVAKVIQCLPITVDDWKKYDARTNEEAIETLRELVHGFGYSWRILHDREVMQKIEYSYNTYLDFVYGENEAAKDWNKILNNRCGYYDTALVLCSDKEFDDELKLALERREEKRQNWCRREYDASILENLEATEDTSL